METESFITAIKYLGSGICIGFGAIGAALGEGYAAGSASQAISIDERASGNIMKNMLVGQAIAESASIFALVVALILLFGSPDLHSRIDAFSLLGAGLAMGLGAIGSGIGAGLPAGACCMGIVMQPKEASKITTSMLIGSAISQTPAIFSLVISFMLIFLDHSNIPLEPGWAALVGCGFCIGLAAIGPGMGNGITAKEAVEAIARQPSSYGNIIVTMLLATAVAQTPAILGLVISFLLLFLDHSGLPSMVGGAALIGCGLSTGLAAIGPGIGNGLTGGEAVYNMGRCPEQSAITIRTMLVALGVSQSTAIYGFMISLMLLFMVPDNNTFVMAMRMFAAGICMGFGAIGPGLGVGITGAYAVRQVPRYPDVAIGLTRTMLVGMAVSESTGIYSLIIALLLIVL